MQSRKLIVPDGQQTFIIIKYYLISSIPPKNNVNLPDTLYQPRRELCHRQGDFIFQQKLLW